MRRKSGWMPVMACLAGATASMASITLEPLDRFLDLETYRASYSTDPEQRFYRIKTQ